MHEIYSNQVVKKCPMLVKIYRSPKLITESTFATFQQNPKIQHHYYHNGQLEMILSQFNPLIILKTYFPVILQNSSVFLKWLF